MYCHQCGYDLQGTPGRFCPECGDVRRVAHYSAFQARRERALRPILWPAGPLLSLVAVLVVIATVWSARLPGGFEASLIALTALAGWLYLVVVWVCAVAAVYKRPWARTGIPAGIRPVYRAIVLPAVVIAVVLTIRAGMLQAIALRVSMPSPNRLAAGVMAQQAGGFWPDRWVGVYHAEQIESVDGGVRFKIKGASGLVLRYGFAYWPDGPPPPTHGAWKEYTHMDGNWYLWKMYGL